METTENNKQSTQESSSAEEHRHQEAMKFTGELVEELLSSTDKTIPDK